MHAANAATQNTQANMQVTLTQRCWPHVLLVPSRSTANSPS